MIASCLVKDPSKRPSAKKLLKHPFFKQARSSDYIGRTLLEGLPDLGERIKELKVRYWFWDMILLPIIHTCYFDFVFYSYKWCLYWHRGKKKICLHKKKCQMGKRRSYHRFYFWIFITRKNKLLSRLSIFWFVY